MLSICCVLVVVVSLVVWSLLDVSHTLRVALAPDLLALFVTMLLMFRWDTLLAHGEVHG